MPSNEEAFAALERNDVDELRGLLAAAPELAGARRGDGISLLMLARYRADSAAVDLILATGIELDLFEAAATGRTERLTALLDAAPSSVGSYSTDGWTALHLASFFGQLEAAELLIERAADPLQRSRKPLENHPLHAAAAGNHTEVCRLLLDHGADPNATQSGGFAPLHAAAQNGNRELVELLLDRGADRSVRTEDGRTALDIAREAGREGLLEVLE